MVRYFTSERKEEIWLTLQIFGALALFIGLLVGVAVVMSSMADSGNKIDEEIEAMSCDELRQFLLDHGSFSIGFSKAERLFKYRPCE